MLKKFSVLLLAVVSLLLVFACTGCRSHGEANDSSDVYNPLTSSENNPSSEISGPDDSSVFTDSGIDDYKVKQEPEWKEAYRNYIVGKEELFEFDLVYVDSDDIPELFIGGDCNATGDALCTYYGDKVVEFSLPSIGGDYYIPKSGFFRNASGNMGYYYISAWKMENGKSVMIFDGIHDSTKVNEALDVIHEYYIGGEKVTEEAFNKALNAVYDTKKEKSFYTDYLTDYEGILKKIENW